jgi:hypothetical protein
VTTSTEDVVLWAGELVAPVVVTGVSESDSSDEVDVDVGVASVVVEGTAGSEVVVGESASVDVGTVSEVSSVDDEVEVDVEEVDEDDEVDSSVDVVDVVGASEVRTGALEVMASPTPRLWAATTASNDRE